MSLDAVSFGGRFGVLAVDHRDSLRQLLAPHDPTSIAPTAITELKRIIVSGLGELATGVMLEPEFSIPQLLDGTVPSGVGVIAALESQGYLADPEAAPTSILDVWSVEAAKNCGAAAVKLLVPYHPDRPFAVRQGQVVSDILNECRRVGIPLVLEPLFYGLDDPADRERVVVETVDRFVRLGPDVLKLPFPAGSDRGDRSRWSLACREISARCDMPWALLSGGGTYELFRDQLEAAVSVGCAGFMVGRALWREAATAPTTDRARVIEHTIAPRMIELRGIVGVT